MGNINFAKLIKQYRNKKFITQEELANQLGVSFVTVNRWEKGKYDPTMKQKRVLYELFEKEGLIK